MFIRKIRISLILALLFSSSTLKSINCLDRIGLILLSPIAGGIAWWHADEKVNSYDKKIEFLNKLASDYKYKLQFAEELTDEQKEEILNKLIFKEITPEIFEKQGISSLNSENFQKAIAQLTNQQKKWNKISAAAMLFTVLSGGFIVVAAFGVLIAIIEVLAALNVALLEESLYGLYGTKIGRRANS